MQLQIDVLYNCMGHKSLMQSGTIIKTMSTIFVNEQKNCVNITVVNNNEIYDITGIIPSIIKEVEKESDSLFVFEGLEYTCDELIEVLSNFINQ